MKKLCKITSLFLTVILIFVSTCVYVTADSKIQDKTAFLTALEILKGDEAEKISAGESLARADAAYYALRALGYGEAPKASSYGYSDVTDQTKNADDIAYALSLGLISPAEEFYPESKATTEQLIKMVITAMGYKSTADMHGGYPDGYMALANNLGILSGTGLSARSEIPYSSLNTLLDNILSSGYFKFDGSGKYELSEEENILYERFGIYKYSGIVTENAVTSLVEPEGLGEEQIKIADMVFDVSSKELYTELSKKLGFKVNAYVRENDNDADEIVYYEIHGSFEAEEIYSENFDDFSNGKLKYTVSGGREKSVSIPGDCYIIYNGKAVTTPVSGDLFEKKWGSITLVKENNTVKAMLITAYENYYVGAIDKEKYGVYDNTVNNRYILFEDTDGSISKFAYFKNKTGAEMTFDQIPVGAVISVAASGDYFDVIVTQETVSGTVTAINYQDTDVYITVDSNVYKLSAEMDKSRVANIKIGKAYTFRLDACGMIAAGEFGLGLSGEMDWVYLINIYDDDDDDQMSFKLVTRAGNVASIKCADRVTIDGVSYKRGEKSAVKSCFMQNNIVLSQALRLSVNDDGDINKIDTVYMNTEKENQSEAVRVLGTSDVARRWRSGLRSFNAEFVLASDAVIFSVPAGVAGKADKGDSSEYGVATTDIWRSDREAYVTAYNSSIYSRIAEAVVTTDAQSVSSDNQDYVTVITELVQAADEDGNVGIMLKGIQNGSNVSKFVTDEKELTVGGIKVAAGDVIRYGIDNEGKVKNIVLYYDASSKTYLGSGNLHNTWEEFQTGMVKAYRIEDGYITVEVNDLSAPDDPNGTKVTTKTNAYRVVEVDMSGKKPVVSKSAVGAVKDWYTYGSDYSYMFMQNRYYEGRTLVIYKY